jgi:phosphate transport system protein
MDLHPTARTEFQQELEQLEAQTLGGLDLVRDQLERVMRALADHDATLARSVVEDDDTVDALFFELHDRVLCVLALQAPVAGDLRLAAALLHIARLIERMGDQCVNVAKLIPLDGRHPRVHRVLLEELGVMGKLVAEEVSQAKQAFATRDLALARELVDRDRDVNELNRRVFGFAWESGEDPDTREWAMHMVLAARAIERIGDQCVDVGEQLGFVVTGRFEEFRDASHPSPSDAAPSV